MNLDLNRGVHLSQKVKAKAFKGRRKGTSHSVNVVVTPAVGRSHEDI